MAEKNYEGPGNVIFFFLLGILTSGHRGANSIDRRNGLIAIKLRFRAQSDRIICDCQM